MLKEILENHINVDEVKNEITMKTELSRDAYLELKSYIEIIQGEYKTSGKKFVFQINPRPLIDAYLKSGIMPKKNPTAFFPTPTNIVKDMLRLSDFDYLPTDKEFQSRYRVLEPSGGVGGIASLIKDVAPHVQLDIVEILDVNQEVLRQKGYEPICMDFMEYNNDFSIKYDYVVMNPPYQGKTYIKHIKRAYDMLDCKGILVAVIPTSFLQQDDKESLWLYEKVVQTGEVYHNPKGSFKEQGTNVDTCIICINKENESSRAREYQGCANFWTWQIWISLYTDGDVYDFLSNLKDDKDVKVKIKNLIIKKINNLKRNQMYYSYDHLDSCVEKLYEHFQYIKEENLEYELLQNKEEYTYEDIKEDIACIKTPSIPFMYDDVVLSAFASGKLF